MKMLNNQKFKMPLNKKMIAPSLLSANFANLQSDIEDCIQGGADMLHLDIMDGHFVPNITFGPPIVEAIRKITRLPLSCHLMISNPDKFIESFVKAGADYISVHTEGAIHLHRTIQFIKDFDKKAGIVLNPATPLEFAYSAAEYVDFILLMSVNPGFGGQEFIKSTLKKIETLKIFLINNGLFNVLIEIDGGVKFDNAIQITNAGADILVCGTGIFNGNIKENIQKMRKLISS